MVESHRIPVMSPPTLGRRAFGGVALAAALAASRTGHAAADASTFVSAFGLPANLDPHQVFDVPMQNVILNAYDGLYRYQNDPPELVPWLAESHTVSGMVWSGNSRCAKA
jgi:peptide/nickel transport system substrate-binding protein